MKYDMPIVIAMSSFPSRKIGMLHVINSLIDQCDIFCVWLNNYDEVPCEILKFCDKIKVVLSNVDEKERGRYLFMEQHLDSYYIIVDDDIDYPCDYVDITVKNLRKYPNSFISYHGKVNREVIHFFDGCNDDMICERMGGGVSACIPKNIVRPNMFNLTYMKHPIFDGDQSITTYCKNNGIYTYVLKHKKEWMKDLNINGQQINEINALKNSKYTKQKRKLINKFVR